MISLLGVTSVAVHQTVPLFLQCNVRLTVRWRIAGNAMEAKWKPAQIAIYLNISIKNNH
jgi:hypothetical protein